MRLTNTVHVQPATREFALGISELAKKTYRETYPEEITVMTDAEGTLEKMHGVAVIEKYLQSSFYRLLIALDDFKRLMGYLLLVLPTEESTENPSEITEFLERNRQVRIAELAFLSKIYVLSEFKRQGIGKQLLSSAVHLEDLVVRKYLLLIVYSQVPAVRFYEKYDFRKTGHFVFFQWPATEQRKASQSEHPDYEMLHSDLPALRNKLTNGSEFYLNAIAPTQEFLQSGL